MDLSDFIYNKLASKFDPIQYIERVLRAHLPESKRHLHENQIELVRTVCNPKIRKVAALMARQSGKCFKKGTKIMMADGNSKLVENIQVGDQVMSPTCQPVLVTNLGHGTEEMFTIKPKDKHYAGFTVNKSHILSLWNKSKNQYVNITVNDYLQLTDNEKNKLYGYRVPIEFEEVKLPIDPYFIGLWLGDDRKTYPEIATVDQEIINYLQDYANQLNMQLVVYKGNEYHIDTYALTNKEKGKRNYKNIITQWLKIFNLYDNKHIPNIILHNSINIRQQVLAGLIDSDGSSAKDLHTVELTFTNGQLATGVLQLLRTLGYKASMRLKNIFLKSRNKHCSAYKIHAYGDFSVIPTKIQRKQFNSDIHKDPLKFKFDVISEGIDKYYGFTVNAKDGLFLLEDCTVVHNTESIASFSGYLLDNYPNMRIGIFTPRVQQAEVNVGRTSIFFQMNEDKLNNKLVKCTKQKIELSNGSYVSAVSGSDQSNIEGLTFDIIILDEAQKISNYTWSERISPMGGATNAKLIKIRTLEVRRNAAYACAAACAWPFADKKESSDRPPTTPLVGTVTRIRPPAPMGRDTSSICIHTSKEPRA